MSGLTPSIFRRLSALSDPTRSRVLLLLDGHELTVTELCTILQLPQSTVSRHLKALGDTGWTISRTEGTSHLYTLNCNDGDDLTHGLWQLVRGQVATTAVATQDEHRLRSALADRRVRSQEFFATSAGQWDHMREELFGERFHFAALGALASEDWVAGDLGCGTGHTSAALAPFVSRVVAVDASVAMLEAAACRLAAFPNVELRQGELEALPIDDASLDVGTLMLVLHHLPEPQKAIAELARVLKPAGRVIIVDMLPHDREGYRRQMGHIWLGFSEGTMSRMLTDAGFGQVRVALLAPETRAKGPALFVASGEKRGSRDHDQ